MNMEIFANPTLFALGIAVVSFTTSLFIVGFKNKVPRVNGRPGDTQAVQAAHTNSTPRIGGVGLFCAIAVGIALAPPMKVDAYMGIFVAATFLFAVGLAEDIGFDVAPRRRMIATLLASLIVIWFLGGWLPRVDIPVFDDLLGYWFLGIPMTLLLTAGVTNGFNLIDGVNGLAATTGIVAAVALGLIAQQVSYDAMVYLTLLVAAGLLGFLVLNYPFGLIFLGDAGAYAVGFVLAWVGVSILAFCQEVSAWAILLTVFWPLADTLVAIFRRRKQKGATMSPDRLHVHQMVMRALEICFFGRSRRHISNPLSTLVLLPFVVAPPMAGVLLWNQPLLSFLAVISFCTLFVISYITAGPIIRRFRRQNLPD